MRKLFGILSFVLCALTVSAQQVHFIYLQTEDGHSFYVKMNSKILSSSGSGYLIMPDLVDSTYSFSIGFAGSSNESRFRVPVSGKDRGLLIKTLEKQLALFDMQSLTLIHPHQDQGESLSFERRNDDFSSLLSKAARDTSLLYSVVKKQAPPAQKPVEEPVVAQMNTSENVTDKKLSADNLESNGDSIASIEQTPIEGSVANSETTGTSVNSSNIPDSTITEQVADGGASAIHQGDDIVYNRSTITKHSESSTSEGFGLVFFDDYGNGVDTIQLIIPNQKLVFRAPAADTSKKAVEFIEWGDKPDTTTNLNAAVKPESAPEKKETVLAGEKEERAGVKRNESVKSRGDAPKEMLPTPADKTNCKTVATNRDFFKLRKNMAAEETDEGMVDQAKKYFKTKCFSTEQIKNLSALFLTSAGKYQFFDAAFFHVTDPEAFRQLGSEIKDDYYFRRFQALIGE